MYDVCLPRKGALSGFVVGFVVVFWMALGSYEVETYKDEILPTYTYGCQAFANFSLDSNASQLIGRLEDVYLQEDGVVFNATDETRGL